MYFVISSIMIIIGSYFGIVATEQYMQGSSEFWVLFRIYLFYAMFIIGAVIAAIGSFHKKS